MRSRGEGREDVASKLIIIFIVNTLNGPAANNLFILWNLRVKCGSGNKTTFVLISRASV